MSKGSKFSKVKTSDPTLTAIQQNVADLGDQLEDNRRGVIAYPSRTLAGAAQMGEDAVVRYTGGAALLLLPPADLRGRGRSQVILVLHGGLGTLTVKASGADTLAAAVALTVGQGVVLVSDGYTAWTPIGLASGGSLPNVGPGAGTYGNTVTSVTLDAQGRVTAVAAGNEGTATLDFGAFPGASDASVAVAGQTGIVAGSILEAWIRPAATADHSVDEHLLETLEVAATDIIAGTGFTIRGVNEGSGDTRLHGQWSVAWRWN